MNELLLCCESNVSMRNHEHFHSVSNLENRAIQDPTLLNDRVFKNLLKTEDRYMLPYPGNFTGKQREVTVSMRRIVAEWMMEVCEEQKCQDEVFSSAINYMDRFLMCCDIKKNQLQLLGTACMLIASKLKESNPLDADTLVYYTDNGIKKHQLTTWELIILCKLKWDVATITPHDFLEYLFHKLSIQRLEFKIPMVFNHAKIIITLCGREFQFSRYHSSIIACSSVASALIGLGWTEKSGCTANELLNKLTELTNIEKDYIEECLHQIEIMLKESMEEDDPANANTKKEENNENVEKNGDENGNADNFRRNGECTPSPQEQQQQRKKNEIEISTPTDVQDVYF